MFKNYLSLIEHVLYSRYHTSYGRGFTVVVLTIKLLSKGSGAKLLVLILALLSNNCVTLDTYLSTLCLSCLPYKIRYVLVFHSRRHLRD